MASSIVAIQSFAIVTETNSPLNSLLNSYALTAPLDAATGQYVLLPNDVTLASGPYCKKLVLSGAPCFAVRISVSNTSITSNNLNYNSASIAYYHNVQAQNSNYLWALPDSVIAFNYAWISRSYSNAVEVEAIVPAGVYYACAIVSIETFAQSFIGTVNINATPLYCAASIIETKHFGKWSEQTSNTAQCLGAMFSSYH